MLMTQAEMLLICKENKKDILRYSNQKLKKDTTPALFLKNLRKDTFTWNNIIIKDKNSRITEVGSKTL